MATEATTRRARRKATLTIAWIATCGVVAGLLLHPAVPALIRTFVARPNRSAAVLVEYAAHVAVFFVATQLGLICFEATTRKRLAVVVGLACVAGIAAEAAQGWVPTRGVDVLDAACNLLGIALAAVAYRRMFSPQTAKRLQPLS
jgi:VanZ family protein